MLAPAHAKIDVFEGEISLEVGTKKVAFNDNEWMATLTVSPVNVINDFQVIDDFGALEDLEELLMNDDVSDDLGNFLKDNNLLSDIDNQDIISISPSNSPGLNRDSFRVFQDSDNSIGIGIDDFIKEINDIWGDLDLRITINGVANHPLKPEFFTIGNRVLAGRGWNSRSPRLELCGKLVAEYSKLRHSYNNYGVVTIIMAGYEFAQDILDGSSSLP
nr:hypothetical protein [Tanacetum cinerariifolium]